MAELCWETRRPLGLVMVRQEVLTTIALRAVERVKGARALRGGSGLIGIFSGAEETVQILLRRDVADVELRISVVQGYPVHEVARGVQHAVRADLEGLVGIAVGKVDVSVRQVIPAEQVLMLEEEDEDAEG